MFLNLHKQFLLIGEHAACLFRVDQLTVNAHLKHPATRRNQSDFGAQPFNQQLCQTGSRRFIVSLHTIFNINMHDVLPKADGT